LETLVVGVDDDTIVDVAATADRTGVDVPLGWPEDFIALLEQHRRGDQGRFAYADAWTRLAYRETDVFIHETFGVRPLSVSTDRLGLTALRASAIQALLRDSGRPVDRAGGGVTIEVYPAVALRQWGLINGSYKGANRHALPALVDRLQEHAPWLELGSSEGLCRSSDDAFDAVVAALVARAHALDLWHRPTDTQAVRARSEGWIVVPNGTLIDLVG
jgi:predicted nuclease with RNAse H fold